MIAVIADDFTGAAEIGGVALRHGLNVIIETDVNGVRDIDIVVIATNTRSMSGEKAKREVKKIVNQLSSLNPDFIFKKIDSVLRGNILVELYAHMEALNKKRALVIAGNPYFGRLIHDGVYYINDVPLSETFFGDDPEYPVKSSLVKEIVETDDMLIHNIDIEEEFPKEGVFFGNISSTEEMHKWASRLDNTIIPAGGSGFFNAIIGNDKDKPADSELRTFNIGDKALFVFGSTYPKPQEVVEKLTDAGLKYVYMPDVIYSNPDFPQSEMNKWVDKVVEVMEATGRVIVTTNNGENKEKNLASRIQKNYAELVARVMQKVQINDLLIEGGATTSEILKKLGISKLFPYREIDVGVIQMKVKEYEGLNITTKPGSYLWPKNFIF